jgi:iron complex outermembrane receptor protein
MSLNYTKELLQTWRDAILDKSSCGNLKLLFEYVGYSNQVKTIKIKPNQNDLNVTLEPTVFEMDAVIVSTAFNKIQSQNVMKVEHKTIKELQQGTATLEGLATIPGVSQVSTGTSIGNQ